MLRALVRLNGKPDWLSGIRVATAMFVPIVIGAAVDQFIDGLFVGVGGMLVAACDTGGPYAQKLRLLAVTALGVAVALSLGCLVGEPTWLAAVCGLVLISALGLLGALGMAGTLIGFIVSLAFVIGVGLAGSPETALRFLWEIALGGAFGIVLSLVGWPLHPDKPVRQAIARAYGSLTTFARAAGKAERGAPLAPQERSAAITALLGARAAIDSAPEGDREQLSVDLRVVGNLFNAVVGLAQFRQTGPPDLHEPPLGPKLEAAFDQLADAIAVLGRGGTPAIPTLEVGDRPALRRAWRTATDALHPDPDALPPPPPPPPARTALSVIRAQLSWDSVVLRHALRVGVIAAIGIVLSRVIDPNHGTWITLGAMIVLKPDFGGTLNAALGRGAGTLLGAIIAGLLVAAITSRPILIALAAVLTVGAIGVQRVNYTLFMVLLTPLTIVLVAIGAPGDWELADERLLDTLIGIVLALVGGYLLWPSWERRRLPDQLASTLDADRVYLGAVLRALAGGERRTDGMDRARAERENANAAASLQRLRAEPARERGDPEPVDTLATHAQRLVDAATAMAGARPSLPGPVADRVHAFAADADGALADMATAAKSLGAPPPLPELERDLPSLDGDRPAKIVRRELEEVALDIEGMHAALGRVASS